MCGVPVERADDYLQRLIAARPPRRRLRADRGPGRGEEARRRIGRAPRRRAARHARHASPRSALLDPGRANLLVAVARRSARTSGWLYGLAAIDISTGRFSVVGDRRATGSRPRSPGSSRARSSCRTRSTTIPSCADLWRESARRRDAARPRRARRRPRPSGACAISSASRTLDGFGSLQRAPRSRRPGRALAYVERTQFGARPPLAAAAPRARRPATLAIDAATRANLELTRTLAGERAGSLLATIDRTVTPGGARLLAERLAGPLTDAARHRRAGTTPSRFLVDEPRAARAPARAPCAACPTSPGRCRGSRSSAAARATSPACATASIAARAIGALLARRAATCRPSSQARARRSPALDPALAEALAAALADDLPLQPARRRLRARRPRSRARRGARAAAAIRAASSPRCRRATPTRPAAARCASSTTTCSAISSRCRRRSARTFLREPWQRDLRPPPDHGGRDALLDRRARRARSQDRLGGRPRAQRSSSRIFDALAATRARRRARPIAAAAAALAGDRRRGGARRACGRARAGPGRRSTTASPSAIEGGRHPVVEAALKRDGAPFVANDCDLSATGAGQAGPHPASSPARTWAASRPICARTR